VIPVTWETENSVTKKPATQKKGRFFGKGIYPKTFLVARSIVTTWRRRRGVVVTAIVLVVVTVVVAPLVVAVTLLLFPATALFFLFALLTGADGGPCDSTESGTNKGAFTSVAVTSGKSSNGRTGGDAGGGTTLSGSASHREKGPAESETQNELIFHVT